MVISAVPDNFVALLISARSNAGHPQHWATLLGEGSDFYFNGGVFIFHHQNWKTQELNAELLRTLYLVDTGEFTTVFGDQDILNFVTRGFKRKFPRMYNSLISTAAGEFAINSFFDPNKDQPRILHFAGEQKPWKCSVEEVHRISKMSDENSKMGYVDHVQNFYFQYFFIQNQRKIWVHNALK
jgi:lipopolysaccharide biosynthesis glycosyltransferase